MDRNAEYEHITRVPRTRSPRSVQHYLKSTARWTSPTLSQEIRATLCILHLCSWERCASADKAADLSQIGSNDPL